MTSRPLRLMFMSRHSMLDRTSGAALTIIELMRRAAARGLPTRVVTGSVLDVNPPREPQEADFAAWGPLTRDRFGNFDIWRVTYDGVDNVLLRTRNTGGRRLTDAESEALEALWEREVEAFQPDVVLMYCGFKPERRMLERLGRRGVKRVLHLANGNYKHAAVFQDVDLVETTSVYLRNFYNKLDGIEPWVGAPVINPDEVVATRREPRFITFINPAPAKGATLFYQLAGLAAQQIPHAEFLVVESRGHATALREQHGLDLNALPNVTVWPHQQDMREVYGRTRILLMPSFWPECFGRIVVEAGWNGIPTLGARQGGIPEAMNGGGRLLPVPDRCYQSYTAVPTPAEVQPWIDAIAHWTSDADAYAAACRRAREGAAAFDPDRVVDAILDRFNRLTDGHDTGVSPGMAEGASRPPTVVHLAADADGLAMLHPRFRSEGWRVVTCRDVADDGPAEMLADFAEGRATAIQADAPFRPEADTAETVAALQAMSRVLVADGYALVGLNPDAALSREHLKALSEQAGFQQMAMADNPLSYSYCILSKVRRSSTDWQELRSLCLPPRHAANAV